MPLLLAFFSGYALGGLGLALFVSLRSVKGLRFRPRQRDSKHAYIIFGTQTGTAARFSRSLYTQVARRYKGLSWRVIDADDFDERLIETAQVAVFIMASYGDGDPPASAQPLYKALKDYGQNGNKGQFSVRTACFYPAIWRFVFRIQAVRLMLALTTKYSAGAQRGHLWTREAPISKVYGLCHHSRTIITTDGMSDAPSPRRW